MEHACDRCGAEVEDGTPFCSKCNAPQIRVIRDLPAGETTPATPPLEPGTPFDIQPPARPVWLQAGGVDWRAARGRVIGFGLLASVVLLFCTPAVPLFFFAATVGFGIFGSIAAGSYGRARPGSLTPGVGARIGAAVGAVGLVLFDLVMALTAWGVSRLRDTPEIRAVIDKSLQSANSEQRDLLQRLLERPRELMGYFLVIGFFVGLLFVICGAIGGWLRARRHPST